MTLFEFTFALSAVVLGLALTHMAATIHRLLLAGKRVRWAVEPVLLASLVFSVIVGVWLEQWFSRTEESVWVGQIFVQSLKFLTLYFAAASCLPEPTPDGTTIDLYEYYDETRRLTFGALIASLLLFRFHQLTFYGVPEGSTVWDILMLALYPALFVLLLFVRRRWFNKLVLSFLLVLYGGMLLSSGLTT